MKYKVTFILGLGGEQIEFKTDRDDYNNEIKFRYENNQLIEVNNGNETILINPSKILFAKIKEVTD